MVISKAHVLYMTGTGTTRRYAEAFGEGLPFDVEFHEIRHDAELPESFAFLEPKLDVAADPQRANVFFEPAASKGDCA